MRGNGPDTDFGYACTAILTLEIWPWVKVMTHSLVMDNNCVKYYPNPTWQWGFIARKGFWVYVYCDLDLGDMTLSQGHDTHLGQKKQLREIISRSNLAVRSYGPDTDFGYVCTVTLTLEKWPLVKFMTHPWVMDNNCVKYYPNSTWQWGVLARTWILGMCAPWPWPWGYDLGSRSWHTLGSWTTIVWNIIQIGQVGKKLWPEHNVNRQTDRVIPMSLKLCWGYKYYRDPTWQYGVQARTRILCMWALWPSPRRYDIGSRSWHTLGSWTTIVWNKI